MPGIDPGPYYGLPLKGSVAPFDFTRTCVRDVTPPHPILSTHL